jgi:hypothetical protein
MNAMSRMHRLLVVLLGSLAVVIGVLASPSSAAERVPSPATPPGAAAVSASHAPAAGNATPAAVYYYNTWKNATGFCDGGTFRPCGTLFAGRNYFYYQCPGARWEDQGYRNYWWAFTDLDTPRGSRGWVSAVYFTVGGQNEPIPGLPRGNC